MYQNLSGKISVISFDSAGVIIGYNAASVAMSSRIPEIMRNTSSRGEGNVKNAFVALKTTFNGKHYTGGYFQEDTSIGVVDGDVIAFREVGGQDAFEIILRSNNSSSGQFTAVAKVNDFVIGVNIDLFGRDKDGQEYVNLNISDVTKIFDITAMGCSSTGNSERTIGYLEDKKFVDKKTDYTVKVDNAYKIWRNAVDNVQESVFTRLNPGDLADYLPCRVVNKLLLNAKNSVSGHDATMLSEAIDEIVSLTEFPIVRHEQFKDVDHNINLLYHNCHIDDIV